MTSPFGIRIHPITKEKKQHLGVDYGTKGEKWAQYALEDGTVLSCGKDSAGANALFVWVSYPRLNLKLLHYHLDSISVRKGQVVNENTVLGYTGTTGNSTGIHLHLGAKHISDNIYFDPEEVDYIPQKSVVSFALGDKVKIDGSLYASGKKIPEWVKKGVYQVGRISSDKFLLVEEVKDGKITKNGIYSWVYKVDVVRV